MFGRQVQFGEILDFDAIESVDKNFHGFGRRAAYQGHFCFWKLGLKIRVQARILFVITVVFSRRERSPQNNMGLVFEIVNRGPGGQKFGVETDVKGRVLVRPQTGRVDNHGGADNDQTPKFIMVQKRQGLFDRRDVLRFRVFNEGRR